MQSDNSILNNLFGNKIKNENLEFLSKFSNEELLIVKDYLKSYNQKLQLFDTFLKNDDSFSRWLNKKDLDLLNVKFGVLLKIDLAESKKILKDEKNVIVSIRNLIKIIEHEKNSLMKNSESKIIELLNSLNQKLIIFEKNLSLQVKWFKTNKTVAEQNKNKLLLLNLVKREGVVLFDINSSSIKEMIVESNNLLSIHLNDLVHHDTYKEVATELSRELVEFDNDNFHFDIDKIKPLGGGFKNPVLLVKLSDNCELVAKAFTEKGSFKESLRARKFIEAAGGLVPEIVKISDNEIICAKISGTPLRKILVSDPQKVQIAFTTLGKSLAMIHKNTLNKMAFYDPKVIFRKGYTGDYVKIKEHMKILKSMKLIDDQNFKDFLKVRKKYVPNNLAAIIHGDAHLDNFFFLEDAVKNIRSVAIVDYDDAKVGDPFADVGRVIASIRNWQHKAKLDEQYTSIAIDSFIQGYNSVLNLDIRACNLYTLRLYLIIVKSSKALIDKLNNLMLEIPDFKLKFGNDFINFFKQDFEQASIYFTFDEFDKLKEIKFCLIQIRNFIDGNDVLFNKQILSKLA